MCCGCGTPSLPQELTSAVSHDVTYGNLQPRLLSPQCDHAALKCAPWSHPNLSLVTPKLTSRISTARLCCFTDKPSHPRWSEPKSTAINKQNGTFCAEYNPQEILFTAVIIERTEAHRPRLLCPAKNIASYRTCESGLEWLRSTPATRLRSKNRPCRSSSSDRA
jgi:hypothetical protein